jgi:hypothetical protein
VLQQKLGLKTPLIYKQSDDFFWLYSSWDEVNIVSWLWTYYYRINWLAEIIWLFILLLMWIDLQISIRE